MCCRRRSVDFAIEFSGQETYEAALNSSLLLWSVLFGSVGLGFFMYGRKQNAIVPLVCGLALMIFPYFIPNMIALIVVGCALIVFPYFVRI